MEFAYEYCRKMEASYCPILIKIEYNDKFFQISKFLEYQIS